MRVRDLTSDARLTPRRRRALPWTVLLTIGLGVLLVTSRLGNPLARLSYDIPFLIRGPVAFTNLSLPGILITNVAVVVVGEDDLRQPASGVSRADLAALTDRLTDDGAPLVVFDFKFDHAATDPAEDARFAAAIRQHGRVVLGAYVKRTAKVEQVLAPTPVLREAARAWGVLNLDYDRADLGIRRLPAESNGGPSLSWVAARAVITNLTAETPPPAARRWLNYLGPAGQDVFHESSLTHTLNTNLLPSGHFRHQIVIVGSKVELTSIAEEGKGTPHVTFRQPWVRIGRPEAEGYEVRTTALANLLGNPRYLTRLSPYSEAGAVAVIGALLGVGLLVLRPGPAAVVGAAAGMLIIVASTTLQNHRLVWWSWMVPVGAQIPLAWLIGAIANTRKVEPSAGTFDVFISYRRGPGDAVAQLIRTELGLRGYRAFLDVIDVGNRIFDERLLTVIDEAPHFILILSPGALEGCADPADWVRLEASRALSGRKNILPLMLPGFRFPTKGTLPDELLPLTRKNAVHYSHDHFTATLDELLKRLEE